MNTMRVLGMLSGTGNGGSVYNSPAVRAGAVVLCLFFGSMSSPVTASTPCQHHIVDRTTSGPQSQFVVKKVDTTSAAVMEIRRRSGLNWDELADSFQVSRRAIHLWANGQAPSAANEIAIRETLTAIRHIDQGSARDTRALLLTADGSGMTALGLLKAGRYQDAMTRFEGGALAVKSTQRVPLSPKTIEARRHLSPASLLSDAEESVNLPAKARVARVMRVPRPIG